MSWLRFGQRLLLDDRLQQAKLRTQMPPIDVLAERLAAEPRPSLVAKSTTVKKKHFCIWAYSLFAVFTRGPLDFFLSHFLAWYAAASVFIIHFNSILN